MLAKLIIFGLLLTPRQAFIAVLKSKKRNCRGIAQSAPHLESLLLLLYNYDNLESGFISSAISIPCP